MPMMNIRKVLMLMHQGRMRMFMHMRLLAVPWFIVCMQMMRIVHMAMCVLHGFVLMGVGVVFSQVQTDAQRHQRGCDPP